MTRDGCEESNSVFAFIDPPIKGGQTLTLLRSAGTELFRCEGCGKDFSYTAPNGLIIRNIACSYDCALKLGFLNDDNTIEELEEISVEEIVDPEIIDELNEPMHDPDPACNECGGELRWGAYMHTEECSQYVKKSTKKTRRRFSKRHTSPTCPKCGGIAKGRGYLHQEGCELVAELQSPKRPKECPKCGGPAKGRGYQHTESCEG